MVEKKITESETVVESFVQNPYKYGFKTNIETESFPKGLNLKIIDDISKKKDEPDFLKNFRIKSYEKWKKMEMPNWSSLNIPNIDYQDMQYYSIPKTKKKIR
jgi:Fe-S cluster assembly protein SufB